MCGFVLAASGEFLNAAWSMDCRSKRLECYAQWVCFFWRITCDQLLLGCRIDKTQKTVGRRFPRYKYVSNPTRIEVHCQIFFFLASPGLCLDLTCCSGADSNHGSQGVSESEEQTLSDTFVTQAEQSTKNTQIAENITSPLRASSVLPRICIPICSWFCGQSLFLRRG